MKTAVLDGNYFSYLQNPVDLLSKGFANHPDIPYFLAKPEDVYILKTRPT